ncbi:hypothetical protein BKA66DRAFT_596608 [Pyrenochaeta sp. MPI-SDFR-AT-0127]|nr:hypothetical protein BKA66DRAFT_596608 [Pyrenochaeta sp. MPI-SDFR-AT-0127]
MYLNFANALVSLLAFSQAPWAAQAYPKQHNDLPAHIEPTQEAGFKSYGINVATASYSKRAPSPPLTNWGQYPGTTWSGFVKEPANSGWTEDTIDEYAVLAWRETQSTARKEPTIVAALWVRGKGVYLGSVPRGQNGQFSAQAALDSLLRSQAPILWSVVNERKILAGRNKWHAEDMAMYVYEREEKPQGPGYPPNSYMVVYGQYDKQDKAGPKDPCGSSGDSAKIRPSCSDVLHALHIESAM